MTGSAVAIPLLGATGASAASGTTWDQVATCESGGSWSENSGNGYYGGLQISQANWEKYGGLAYASFPDQASRSQQIAVAEEMLDDQGIKAWPTCGLIAGLDEDSDSAGVDTGTADDGDSNSQGSSDSSRSPKSSDSTDLSDSSESSSPSAESPSHGKSPKEEGNGRGESDKSEPSSESDSGSDSGVDGDDSQDSDNMPADSTKHDESDNFGQGEGYSGLVDTGSLGSGRHRGDTADEAAGESGSGSSAGRHAARGGGGAGDASGDSYTVRLGDTLVSIADSLDLDGGWRGLYALNEQEIGPDPGRIVPGQTLVVGAE
ncbi:transglycosylase family protein [Streptomyces sp. HUCO-GS316]|uniref:transglycosylase family protein n=1 Tax=Streptomyces sp. HUCO-GS316 TaxID=2692198 RepID=UPI00301C709D